jgi:hypothetical protein
MGSVAEWLVRGSAATAESHFLSGFDLLSTRIEQVNLAFNQIWTLGQNFDSWIGHSFLLFDLFKS